MRACMSRRDPRARDYFRRRRDVIAVCMRHEGESPGSGRVAPQTVVGQFEATLVADGHHAHAHRERSAEMSESPVETRRLWLL
jgi:hypothetical protein